MGKAIGLLLTVAGIWVGLEIYQNGIAGAFGGNLTSGLESVGRHSLKGMAAPVEAFRPARSAVPSS